jgi:L-iditol 2-dehydrogenase
VAIQLGADVALDAAAAPLSDQVRELTDGEGAEVVIAGPATVAALETGLACAARGGTVVQFMGTEPGETLALSTSDFYFRELRLVPSYSCGPVETREALALIGRGVIAARHVVTHRFPLAEAAAAYRVAALDKSAIKALVMFDGGSG